MTMTPSAWLYAFLKARESFRPTAYKPTRKDKWTIGYGHTRFVKQGDTCTLEQADAFLGDDVAGAVVCINRAVTVPLTQPEFDALVSLVYNIGCENFLTSHLLQRLDASDYAAAASEFYRWDHQDGGVLEGLRVRREAERVRFQAAP